MARTEMANADDMVRHISLYANRCVYDCLDCDYECEEHSSDFMRVSDAQDYYVCPKCSGIMKNYDLYDYFEGSQFDLLPAYSDGKLLGFRFTDNVAALDGNTYRIILDSQKQGLVEVNGQQSELGEFEAYELFEVFRQIAFC